MKPPVFLYLPPFDQNKILQRKKNSEHLFQRNIKIIGFYGLNKLKCDIKVKNEFELLKKVSNYQSKTLDRSNKKESKQYYSQKFKFETPLLHKNRLKSELSNTLNIQNLGNLSNKYTDCNGLYEDVDENKTQKSRVYFKGAFLRESIHSASLVTDKLKENRKTIDKSNKKTYALRKIEWEYSSKLKYLKESSRINITIKRDENRKSENSKMF